VLARSIPSSQRKSELELQTLLARWADLWYSVVKTLGFNRTITLVLTCPPFIFAGVAGILTGWSSGRMHERTWHITGGLLVAIVGFVIAASTLNTAGRYIACFIFPMGAYSVNSVIIGWASSTLSQTREKKAVCFVPSDVFSDLTCSGCTRDDKRGGTNRLYLWCVPVARL
jgi:multisubunit Na+/H+ antiporter MnhG subunit